MKYVLVQGERWEGFYVDGKLVHQAPVILNTRLAEHILDFKAIWLKNGGEEVFGRNLPKDLKDLGEYL